MQKLDFRAIPGHTLKGVLDRCTWLKRCLLVIFPMQLWLRQASLADALRFDLKDNKVPRSLQPSRPAEVVKSVLVVLVGQQEAQAG